MPCCWFSFLWLLCKIGETIQPFMFSHRLISGTKTPDVDFIFFCVLWFADNIIGNYIMGDSTDSLLKAKYEDASYSEQIRHWFWKINTLTCSNRESDWQHVIGVGFCQSRGLMQVNTCFLGRLKDSSISWSDLFFGQKTIVWRILYREAKEEFLPLIQKK